MLELQKDLQKPLGVDQIEFRVQSINKGGYATILAYKDARVDMNRLNQVFGVGFWQRKHEFINGKEYCTVEIWNSEINQWCGVQDVGTVSNTEAEKGQSSDAFKRACFNLGIGIELYDYPLMQVRLNGGNNQKEEWFLNNGKPKAGWGLKLKEWLWYTQFDENNNLTFIAAKDEKGNMRFQWGQYKKEGEG
jgi:hypothetical protein